MAVHLLFSFTRRTSPCLGTRFNMYALLSPADVGPALYSAFTTEVHIPFDHSDLNNAIPFTEDVRTTIRFGADPSTYLYHPIIDTGSCGLFVSANGLPGWNASEASKYPVGWEFLSSSKRLYSGHWIPRDLYLTNAASKSKPESQSSLWRL